jgi:hypothetical protein
MPATPNYLVGKVVAVSVDGDLMYATKGDVNRSVNAQKVTNARSGGFQELKPGIASAKGNVECVYNGDDAPALTLGDEVEVIWTPTGGTVRTLQALITNMKESFVVDGDYTYSFDWESSGAFAL